MKKIIQQLFILCCCIMLCGSSVKAAPKKKINVKTSFAVVSDAKFNKKKLKKNEVFEYSFKISLVDSFDYENKNLIDGSFNKMAPYYYVTVHWKSSKKQQIEQTFKWKRTKNTKTIKGKIPVYPGMQTGKWILDYIEIMDCSPTDDDVTGSRLYISAGTKKQRKSDDSDGYAYRDLSFAGFSIKGKRKADKSAPIFDNNSVSVSKSEAESGEKVIFSVKVEDASEIESVSCGWEVTSLAGGNVCLWDLDSDLKYNKKTQCYECSLSLSEEDLEVRLRDIYTKDIYGNSKTYSDWCKPECENGYKSEYHDTFSRIVIRHK